MNMKHCQPSVITFFYSPRWLPHTFICSLNFPLCTTLSAIFASLFLWENRSYQAITLVIFQMSNLQLDQPLYPFSLFHLTSTEGCESSYQRPLPHWGSKSLPFWLLKYFTISSITSPISYTNLFSTGLFVLAHKNRFQLSSIY